MEDIYTEVDYFFQLDNEGSTNKTTLLRVQVMEREPYIQKSKEIKAAKIRMIKSQKAQ